MHYERYDTSPEARSEFLRQQREVRPGFGTETGAGRITRAERLVEDCDADVQHARERLATLESMGALDPTQARGRHLDPYQRRL